MIALLVRAHRKAPARTLAPARRASWTTRTTRTACGGWPAACAWPSSSSAAAPAASAEVRLEAPDGARAPDRARRGRPHRGALVGRARDAGLPARLRPPAGDRRGRTPAGRQPPGGLDPVAALEVGDDPRPLVALDLDDAVLDRRRPSRRAASAPSPRPPRRPAGRPVTRVTVLPRRPEEVRPTRTMPSRGGPRRAGSAGALRLPPALARVDQPRIRFSSSRHRFKLPLVACARMSHSVPLARRCRGARRRSSRRARPRTCSRGRSSASTAGSCSPARGSTSRRSSSTCSASSGAKIRIVELDTGLLFPETYETRDRLIERYDLERRAHRPPPDRRGAGAHRGPRPLEPRSRTAAAPAQGGAARSARWSAWTPGSPASAARRAPRAPTRRMLELDPRGVVKVQPLAGWSDEDVQGLPVRPRRPLQPAPRSGLPLDRLHPLHPRDPAGRGLARRSLGGRREDRVRAPHARATDAPTSER